MSAFLGRVSPYALILAGLACCALPVADAACDYKCKNAKGYYQWNGVAQADVCKIYERQDCHKCGARNQSLGGTCMDPNDMMCKEVKDDAGKTISNPVTKYKVQDCNIVCTKKAADVDKNDAGETTLKEKPMPGEEDGTLNWMTCGGTKI